MAMVLKKQRDGFIEYILSMVPKKYVDKFMDEGKWEKAKAFDEEIAYILSTREHLVKFLLALVIKYLTVIISGTLEIYLIFSFIDFLKYAPQCI